MAENQGGILLYLDQEGRGNGISNKMRAYRLQSEAGTPMTPTRCWAFDLDQRRFDFAAEMLKQLGVTRVVAMTNNPIKIGASSMPASRCRPAAGCWAGPTSTMCSISNPSAIAPATTSTWMCSWPGPRPTTEARPARPDRNIPHRAEF